MPSTAQDLPADYIDLTEKVRFRKFSLRGDAREIMRRFYDQTFTVRDVFDELKKIPRHQNRVGMYRTLRVDMHAHPDKFAIAVVRKGKAHRGYPTLFKNRDPNAEPHTET